MNITLLEFKYQALEKQNKKPGKKRVCDGYKNSKTPYVFNFL